MIVTLAALLAWAAGIFVLGVRAAEAVSNATRLGWTAGLAGWIGAGMVVWAAY